MKLAEHPTVKRIRQAADKTAKLPSKPLDAGWLRRVALEAGADDVRFCAGRPAGTRRSAGRHPASFSPLSASMWQSLSFGANYKAAYCLSVCPAGEGVIGPYLTDKKSHFQDYVRPLQEKDEAVYVLPGSDAEDHVAKRFVKKHTKHVRNSLRPRSIQGFLDGLPLLFQPNKARGLNATYHFTFTGDEERQATVVIQDRKLTVSEGHVGDAGIHVTANAASWLGFLRRERSLVWALLRRRIRIKGSPKLLLAFGKCFPT